MEAPTFEGHDNHRFRVARAPAGSPHHKGQNGRGCDDVMEDVMDHIANANIVRFNLLLETETDPAKRIMIERLLAEERAKQMSSEARPHTDKTC